MVVSNSLILLLLFLLFFFKHLTSRPDAARCAFFLQWLGPNSMQKPPWCRNPSGNRRSCANVVCVCFGKACCGLLLRGSCWACCSEVGLWIAKRFAWQTAKCHFSFCWLFKTSSTLESATIMRVIKMKWSWLDWKDTWSPPFASCLRLEAYQVRLFSCDERCQKRDPSAEVSWRSRDVETKLWIFGRVWKWATMIPSFFCFFFTSITQTHMVAVNFSKVPLLRRPALSRQFHPADRASGLTWYHGLRYAWNIFRVVKSGCIFGVRKLRNLWCVSSLSIAIHGCPRP